MSQKIPVAILGATGMVGQRFITLLNDHSMFEIAHIAASKRSAGKTYKEAVGERWAMQGNMPINIANATVLSVTDDINKITKDVKMVFCAISTTKEETIDIEESYAAAGVAVVSNNSANRWTKDVPMLMPEINTDHLDMIAAQQKNRSWSTGFIVTKPNCSIQGYVPLIKAWEQFRPMKCIVSTYQALSGAGRTLGSWPEMQDNVIPYIGGEEEKSEKEPLKILGNIDSNVFKNAQTPTISASCVRVPVSDGHLATINIEFAGKPSFNDLIQALKDFTSPIDELKLPSAPSPLVTYFEQNDRPQTKLDRDIHGGMGISIGRLRKDNVLGWKCVSLAHNTVRGAAGGAVLIGELLVAKNYITK